ncbi:hypothetical protein KVR01_006798 [Diaporthe batatas]|uniref:uncharacterized protein n=1 Tax=Diaporthe batatas TaxID=748121 RepID=UPI001D056401|nr:uncharacterized protein KVR01_006798 [Diaporthe batatas]KAG8163501.1 hypothetical protein KVR01_006798 [Diaporthe batatas]
MTRQPKPASSSTTTASRPTTSAASTVQIGSRKATNSTTMASSQSSSSSSPFQSLTKWLSLKLYQVEVTFSVYIFTPLEKFIFWSFVFLLFSLTAIATILYLPHHIMFLAGRAWFYIHGDSAVEAARETARSLAEKAAGAAAAATTTPVAQAIATEMAQAFAEGAGAARAEL